MGNGEGSRQVKNILYSRDILTSYDTSRRVCRLFSYESVCMPHCQLRGIGLWRPNGQSVSYEALMENLIDKLQLIYSETYESSDQVAVYCPDQIPEPSLTPMEMGSFKQLHSSKAELSAQAAVTSIFWNRCGDTRRRSSAPSIRSKNEGKVFLRAYLRTVFTTLPRKSRALQCEAYTYVE